MINVSDMKRGVLIDLDGAPWQVIDCAFQTPSGAVLVLQAGQGDGIRKCALRLGDVCAEIRLGPQS
jgi:hypothetical protein